MVLVLTVVILQSISFSNYALTTKTTNIIYGSAPYLTFDGGRTRVTNTEALLGISLSDGRTFTPTTNNSSSTNPIELPVAGQSFNDIGMLVPTDTDSIALSSLIGTPYNYWGDDDGDGQGIDGITATGSLNLSIVDKDNNPVARNEVLTSCNNNKAPYKLTLSNSEGRLTTRYGVPNESRFSAGNATYYIKPKAAPAICLARPYNSYNDGHRYSLGLSASIWTDYRGFLPQSFTPSSYDLNFPTTGANKLFFTLEIGGNNQALSWAPVSHGGITATMTYSTSTSVRVTLTGPVVTNSNQQLSDNPGRIGRPSLPQTFELVGRDSRGNAVVKYGFVLKQWFVSRDYHKTYSSTESWCNKIGGYRLPKVRDLTNASCKGGPPPGLPDYCRGYESEINALTATPSSPDHTARRHIGGGLFSEWGYMPYYRDVGVDLGFGTYWTQDRVGSLFLAVETLYGRISVTEDNERGQGKGACVYP
ncbi:hypothetical protein [Gilliamella apis]|uniref:hypothetical protein n=1 Tax=Gilliamella apis TaxID=1970738 RepID=UPI000A349326|nr:hypothetical protein [Gilliamella apis]OTQ71254.1 hypothetical protein B6C90_11210 [Gilliamella apis]